MKKRSQKRMSVFLVVLMLISPVFNVGSVIAAENDQLKSPVVDKNGNVTFNVNHDGDQLFIVGSFNEWDIENAVAMNKQDDMFTKTLSLNPGTYEYKYAEGTSWEEGDFPDPQNPLKSSGNSVVHVPGVIMNDVPSSVSQGSAIALTGSFIDETGNKSSVSPNWSLKDTVAGVALEENVLTVAGDVEVDRTFTIKAEYDGYISTQEITIVEALNEYVINYYRYDGNAMNWDMWIYGDGLDGDAYEFQELAGKFARASYQFTQDEISVITRPGNWDTQEAYRLIKMPQDQNKVEVWIVQGDEQVYYSEPEISDNYFSPTVRFVYEREHKDYEDWNIWVWNSGAQDDQIDFDEINDVAIANIEVGSKTESMGFKLRKGTDWDMVDVDEDREIIISPMENLTKVYVNEGEFDFFTVPFASAPQIDEGQVTFFYRDADLYREDAMDKVESVQVKIDGQVYDMVYEEKNERFTTVVENLPEGSYEYTYLVTMDGETYETSDPYNLNDDEKSIIYISSLDLEIEAEVKPSSIDYNQNAVLSLNISDLNDDNELDPNSIREMYVNLIELGGSEQTQIDPELNAVTIAVKDTVSTGEKILPITIVDEFGGVHTGETTVKINPRSLEEDDFDWDEASIYFMLTDRFADGNKENNNNPGYNPDQPGHYHGGDFKGVTNNLDYLSDLGINTIWITPIVENIGHDVAYNDSGADGVAYYGYHGYWASDFESLNPHLGTLEEFHELIDAASERGIKIMVDVVLNHVGYGLKMEDGDIEDPPAHYPTDEDREKFEHMIRQDGGTGGEVTGELSGLPDFITEDPEVREQIVNWQVDWLEKSTTPNGNTIDYFRVDTVKHVENTTWMHFKNELTLKQPEFKLIGEAWGAGPNNQYAQRYLNNGMMDSLLDFEFKGIARDLVNGNIETVHQKISERTESIDNTATLGQFLGSHDEPGFLHFINDQDTNKLKVAATLQITSKGQPVIYYGEELGLSGEDNWPYYDNRYDFPWDEVDGNDVHEHYQKLLNIRKNHSKIFSKGTYELLEGNDELGYMVYQRTYDGKSAIVGINTKEEAESVSVKVPFKEDSEIRDAYTNEVKTIENNRINLTLPGREAGGTFILVSDQDDQEGSEGIQPIPENTLRVHYQREDGNYTDFGLWLWDDVLEPSEEQAAWPEGATPFVSSQITDYGAYLDIPVKSDAKKVGFLVLNINTGDKDGDDKKVEFISPELNEVWIKEGSDEVSLIEPLDLPNNTVRVHYKKEDKDYNDWGIWTWDDVASPSDNWPNGAQDPSGIGKFGAYYDIELKENAEKIGFLFLDKKDEDQTDDYTFSILNEHQQIFIIEGDDQVYTNPYGAIPVRLLSGEVISDKKIQLHFTTTEGISEDEFIEELNVIDKDDRRIEVDRITIKNDNLIDLHGNFDLDAMPFTVTYDEETISVTGGWRMIDELYGYDGELGATLHSDGTATLKLWSPKADNVSVVLYDKTDQFKVIKNDIQMSKDESGVWHVTLDRENTDIDHLKGYYYHYKITHGVETKLALDPYAKSMATWANEESGGKYPIGKAAIVDPSIVGPKLDFAEIEGYEKREDAIIYEVHVRDFTSDPSIADDLTAQFGTFASFVEKLDYIQGLGVTHIQLLPVMSYFWGNEWKSNERLLEWSSSNNNYNWGYDPHSYFSLSGMYSENPDDPELRIQEFKMLIDEIHKRGMGVILDVVYNHTAKLEIFEDLVPNYYHFMDADGTPRESFGGGRLGTTHKMARRILVDSITYWVDEFKVDGFRFDMMGDHDAETIQLAYDKAKELNPNILMIGEGWRTYVGDEGDLVMPADQDWMKDTDSVGVFSDEIRNELKSGFPSEGEPRFLTGGVRNIQQIFDNLTANPHNFQTTDPGDVVQYIAAHDNLTLHDVIAYSIKKDPEYYQEEIHKRIRLGNTMVLTAQGTAFLHAGQEFGRTKQFRSETDDAPYKSTYMTDEEGNPFNYPYFIHDSYDSSDSINKFDWEKATNEDLYPINHVTKEYTKGLIELRRSTDAFRLGTMDEINERVKLINTPEIQTEDLIIGYQTTSSDDSEEYYVFINADDKERTLTFTDIDLTEGKVIVDSEEAGIKEILNPTGVEISSDQITIDSLTAVVVKMTEEIDDSVDPVISIPDDIVNGKATVKNKDINKVSKNGEIIIDLTSTEDVIAVEFTENQIRELKDKKAQITIEKVGLKVSIPTINLSNNGDVSIRMTKVSLDEIPLPTNNKIVSDIYRFTIMQNGQLIDEFDINEPVTLSIAVDESKFSNSKNLGVFYLDEDLRKWIEIEGGIYKDGFITVTIDGFSIFTVMELDAEKNSETKPSDPKDDSDKDGPKDDVEQIEEDNDVKLVEGDDDINGKTLPKTATNIYNWLLSGIVILLIGTSLLYMHHRRKIKD